MKFFLIAILTFIVKSQYQYTQAPLYNQNSTAFMQNLLLAINNASTTASATPTNASDSFKNQWNAYFGHNLTEVDATAGNIGCRGRCQKLTSAPVCGTNGIRYFNACDAQCDGISYNTTDLRFNNKCCCPAADLSITGDKRICIVKAGSSTLVNTNVFMVMSKCMYNCLSKSGDSVTQTSTQSARYC